MYFFFSSSLSVLLFFIIQACFAPTHYIRCNHLAFSTALFVGATFCYLP
jgi:hypothetical protein